VRSSPPQPRCWSHCYAEHPYRNPLRVFRGGALSCLLFRPKERVFGRFQPEVGAGEWATCGWLRDLRRTCISELGDLGATDDELVSVSGHGDRQMLNIYSLSEYKRTLAAMQRRWDWRTDQETCGSGTGGDRSGLDRERKVRMPLPEKSEIWCRRADLNRGPTDYESVAIG
jgi:hypothetical protein